MRMTTITTLAVFATLALSPVLAETIADDPRYCGAIHREHDGRIERSRTVLRRFARIHPCPATLQPATSCPGWAIDHVIPLRAGGCDAVVNLQWLPDSIKSCSRPDCKDRWERTYHVLPRQAVNLEGVPK